MHEFLHDPSVFWEVGSLQTKKISHFDTILNCFVLMEKVTVLRQMIIDSNKLFSNLANDWSSYHHLKLEQMFALLLTALNLFKTHRPTYFFLARLL